VGVGSGGVPQVGDPAHDGTQRGQGFAVKAIPFVIMFLSVASIANLSSRAWEHHANFSSYMTGAGIAVLVPIAVIAAMIVEGRWAWAFWVMAVVFAGISGTIQYNIYLLPDSGAMGIAEAVAFGYGVPLSEVMLAIMEARLVIQFERKQVAEAAAKLAEAKAAKLAEEAKAEAEHQRIVAEQRAEVERQRQAAIDAENREFERQRKQAELEAYRIELQQKAELDRERAMADLRIKEQKAAAKVKIGVSTDVSRRLTAIQTGYPYPLSILCVIPGDEVLESELQRIFAPMRTNGEWFRYDGRLRAYIGTVNAELFARVVGD
jgi:hypothetical protein